VLYATDLVVFPRSKTADTLANFWSTYGRDWKFFSTDEKVEYRGQYLRRPGAASYCAPEAVSR